MFIIQTQGANIYYYCSNLQVLERAKEGESLEELRARTAAQFTDEQNGLQNPAKLSKKRKDITMLDEGSMKFQRVTD
jgi:multiple RNA-binding domain-containing protein 1